MFIKDTEPMFNHIEYKARRSVKVDSHLATMCIASCGLSITFSIEELISAADKKLFRQITSNRHCLHSLLPRLRHTKALNSLRSRGHNYQLPQIQSEYFPKQMSFFHTFKLVLVSLIVSCVIVIFCNFFLIFLVLHCLFFHMCLFIVMCALVIL